MKIIFLNVWNGKMRDSITQFLKDRSRDTDVFCLQEVYNETKPLVRSCLPGFQETVVSKPMAFGDNFFGQATYVKEGVPVLYSETLLEHENESGLGLTVHLRYAERDVHICNFHGQTYPEGDDKTDSATRLTQSRVLIDALKARPGIKIIGGDFNVVPQAESIRMFEENGYRDLVKDFHVTTTRNRIALDKYPGHEEYFSDYVFVSSETKVKSFSVPNIDVSDHLPLIVEIDEGIG